VAARRSDGAAADRVIHGPTSDRTASFGKEEPR
jgi:hypothetical protein